MSLELFQNPRKFRICAWVEMYYEWHIEYLKDLCSVCSCLFFMFYASLAIVAFAVYAAASFLDWPLVAQSRVGVSPE